MNKSQEHRTSGTTDGTKPGSGLPPQGPVSVSTVPEQRPQKDKRSRKAGALQHDADPTAASEQVSQGASLGSTSSEKKKRRKDKSSEPKPAVDVQVGAEQQPAAVTPAPVPQSDDEERLDYVEDDSDSNPKFAEDIGDATAGDTLELDDGSDNDEADGRLPDLTPGSARNLGSESESSST